MKTALSQAEATQVLWDEMQEAMTRHLFFDPVIREARQIEQIDALWTLCFPGTKDRYGKDQYFPLRVDRVYNLVIQVLQVNPEFEEMWRELYEEVMRFCARNQNRIFRGKPAFFWFN